MSCGRIFLVAVCLCTPLALAQDDSLITEKAGNNVQQDPDFRIPQTATPSEPWRILPEQDTDVQQVPDFRIPQTATPSEPWRILPKQDTNVQQVPGLRIPPAAAQSEPWRILPKSDSDKGRVIIVSPDGPLAAGTTCYAIRSYVVAPDAKDTDSVHLDGYSTCIPATNFQLKRPDDYFAR